MGTDSARFGVSPLNYINQKEKAMLFSRKSSIKAFVISILLLLSVNLLFWSCDEAWDLSMFDENSQQPSFDDFGEYNVGRRAIAMTDSNRVESYGASAGSSRELMVYLWYPTPKENGASLGPWLDENILNFFVNMLGGSRDSLTSLKTVSYPNAPILEQNEKYNVILMSHGDGFFPFSNYSAAEFLAGHGYVVAGVSHTYNANLTIFPDGRVFESDPKASSTYAEASSTPDSGYTYEIWHQQQTHSSKISGEFADDLQFVLDELERLNESQFSGMLDTENAGAFGHSLGGSGSIEALLRDSRIQAGADMDGSLFISDPVAGTDKAVMFLLSSSYATFMKEGRTGIENEMASFGWSDEQIQSAMIDHFAIKELVEHSPNSRTYAIKGTDHFSFTDMVAINDVLPALLQEPTLYSEASIDPDRSVEIVREYLLNFFNIHLQGKEDSLSSSRDYPEVTEEQF